MLVVVVGLAVAWILGSGPKTVAEVGTKAPDFTVELIDGGQFTLSESRGQPVVLNFWASWCRPCRQEIPDISAFADAHPDITVIGVAVQDPEEASRKFAAEIDASYPLALGTQQVEDSYPVFGLPATYIIGVDGVITDIYNGRIDQETLTDVFG